MVWRFVRYRLSRSFKLDLPKRRLNMSSSLSPELKALCELASREYDPAKLLELTNQISDLLGQQNGKKEPLKADRSDASELLWDIFLSPMGARLASGSTAPAS